MSHWFHRNKLKSTIDQKFDGKGKKIVSKNKSILKFKGCHAKDCRIFRSFFTGQTKNCRIFLHFGFTKEKFTDVDILFSELTIVQGLCSDLLEQISKKSKVQDNEI